MTTTGRLDTVASRLGWIMLGTDTASTGAAGAVSPVIRSAPPPKPVIRSAR